MKTIGIDCRLAGKKHAGIGRYIEELVMRVIKDQSVRWVLFFGEKNQLSLPPSSNVKIVIAPVRHYSVAEQLKLPSIFAREKLDLLHVPHYNVPLFYPGKFVITIHDLLWHQQSNSKSTTLSPLTHALKYQGYKRVVAHATRSALKIITPTHVVKEQILQAYPTLSESKIIPIAEGVGEAFSSARSFHSDPHSKILFYTGSLYQHKNVMLVVKALRQLPAYSLYISSSRSVFVDTFLTEVEKMGMADRVHHLGHLSDEELLEWYKKSFALVQPSLSEGFGLTGIEAMAVGLPVIASKTPIFTEVYKDGCIFFDPRKSEDFVSAVQSLESQNRNELILKGRKIASLYSWDTMADETLKLYATCL